jgi:hypothetical protein
MARIANFIARMSLRLAPRLRWPRRVAGIRSQSFTGPLQLRRALTEKRKLAGKSHFRSNNRDRQFEFTPLQQRVTVQGEGSFSSP